MSDNLRQYRAIRDALTQGYPGEPTGHVARHLTTLAAMASAQLRSFLNPYEFGSACVSAIGSTLCRYNACIARSFIVGMPTVHYIYIPAVFGIGDHHPSPSSPLGPAM